VAVKRTSYYVEGETHPAPIPNGARIGNILYSSAISGGRAEDPQEQANQLFANIRRFMEVAGGSPDNIIHMNVMLRDDKYREYINGPWEAMFPDPHNRPARHALKVIGGVPPPGPPEHSNGRCVLVTSK